MIFEFVGDWPDEGATPELTAAVKRVGSYKGRASYQMGWDAPRWIRGPTPVLSGDATASDGLLRFSINSPTDGPLVVVDTLMVGTAGSAYVVTAEGRDTLVHREE